METKLKIEDLLETEIRSARSLELELATLEARISGFDASLNAINGSPNEAFRRSIQDKIAKDREQVVEKEVRLAEAKARLTAFRESLKILTTTENFKPKDLRPTSELYRIREQLRKVGKPLALEEILALLGVAENKEKYRSLRGTIRAYAKQGNIFTIECEEPHTFGLIEFKKEIPQ